MENENNNIISKKNKYYLYSTFKNIKVPQIKLTNSLKEKTLFSILKNRKNDIESIFNKTKIQNYEDLISFDYDIPKKKKKFIKSRNIISKIKIPKEKIENLEQLDLTERTLSLQIDKPKKIISYIPKNKNNKSLNQTNISNLNTSSDKTYTINNTEDTSNLFMTNNKEYSNEKIITTAYKNFEKNYFFSNKPKQPYKSRNIRLCLQNENLLQSNYSNPKKKIDFNNIDVIKKNKTQSFFNPSQNIDNTNLSITDSFLKRRKSINKKLLEIEEKNINTNFKLKKLIKDWHFFPVLSSSFKSNINDIIDKTIDIKRNGRYEIRKINQNEIYKDVCEKYWDYTQEKDTHKFFNDKRNKELKNIKLKLREDLLRAEKMKLSLKYDKSSSLNYIY